jgi:uncharacterized membrane protein
VTAYLLEWLSLLGRWLHLIAGIAWIGSSFFFIWLNNHLLTPTDTTQTTRGVAGETWMVHGGAFYHAQKYRVAPSALPDSLHWFYWEAYTTFLSGLFLLCLMYYGQAEVYLIDPRVMPLTKPVAIALGIGFIVSGWLIYDAICRSPLGRNVRNTGVVVALLFGVTAWGLCQVFSGRGAFIEFGAMIGSIMVANVFFVIIPGQRRLVNAMLEGRTPDPEDGRRGSLRSTHNTFLTLPVLFTMTSNHYAITYGAHYNWLVLIALSIAGALIRVYFVKRHTQRDRNGRTSPLPLALAAFIFIGLIVTLAPTPSATAITHSKPDIASEFAHVQHIVQQRCATCHTATPTQPGFVAPPKGVELDTPEKILIHVAAMQQQLTTRAMPVGNLTGLTDDERAELLDWMQRGTLH